jgi:arginyl-tRNA synthetase
LKININTVNVIPPNFQNGKFGVCVFGDLTDELQEWSNFWKFEVEKTKFTNIYIPETINLSNIFEPYKTYDYVDAFSPNLNKYLHLGHLSQFVIAKAVKGLNISDNFISIYGDTVTGDITKTQAINQLEKIHYLYDYKPDEEYMASEMKIKENNLKDGTGDYEGTKVFKIDDEYVVGIKSNGNTSYFYQDVALAEQLNGTGLYLTGFEQNNHFNLLKKLFPVEHLGLGLVMLDGKKMSSSEGNVIFFKEVVDKLKEKFDNHKLIYNVIAGQILKSKLGSVKNINMKMIDNVKTSLGLYLSYTSARLKSAGCKNLNSNNFKDQNLQFSLLKAQNVIEPHILFNSLIDKAKEINKLYNTHHIKDNEENTKLFSEFLTDLELGMDYLGLFKIDKV